MTVPVESDRQSAEQDISAPDAPLELSLWDAVLLSRVSATGAGLRVLRSPARPTVTAAGWAEAA